MKKTTLRQVAFKLACVAFALLAPLGLWAQQTAPYNEGFESMSSVSDLNSAGWDMVYQSHTGSFLAIESSAGNVFAGSKALNIDSWNAGSSSDYVIVGLPLITNKEVNELQITFSYKVSTGTVQIGYLTDADDGSTFMSLASFNSSSSYSTQTVELNNAPSEAVRIAIKYSNWYRCYVDAVEVKELPTCIKPNNLFATEDDPFESVLSWQDNNASDPESWTIYYKKVTDADYMDEPGVTDNPYTLPGLEPATSYQYYVVANCDASDQSEPSQVFSFTTACAAIYDLTTPYTMGFETDYLQGTTNALSIPWCWNRLNNATSSSYNSYPYANYSLSDAHGGSRYLRFYYYNYSWSSQADYQIAVLPEIDVDALPLSTLRLRFYARSYSSYSGDISVGTMADPDDPESFSEVELFNITGTTYDLKTVANFPDDGSRYIAIRMLKPAASALQYAYIDDLTLELLPNCLEPSGLQPVANSATTESVELTWTPGGSESEWDIYYTDDPADVPDENTTPMVEGITENDPYLLEFLNPATRYYVYVRANCGGDQSPWSQRGEFTTACDAVTTFPWSENFEGFAAATSPSYVEANKVNDPCWLNEHYLDGTGTSGSMTLFQVCSNNQSGNSTNKLQLPDMRSGTQTLLRLPEMSLPNANYQFVIDVLRNTSGTSSTSEGVRVYASADGEIDNATELGFLYRNCNQTDGNIVPDEGSIGWYTYEFPIPFSGTCYIILRGESQWGAATYMDNLVVEQVPTCRKPTSPVCSAKTAHTATLSWTNGEAGQTAWQIAYKATNNFNPNEASELATATIVDVITNPATIEGLAQSTYYYAYVRANCGGEYSSWSVAYVNFQTLAGNATPTGLAVAANTITSDQATASWNAVAGNTEHQSYDIYWVESPDAAPVTAVPENPTAPYLISGITATSQVISDLTPETKYRVWVRDNCGTDGLSAWSSYVTFTTASACQTPDGLAASSISNNNATFTWNAYGLSNFNIQYRVSGDEWDDNNIINNVNTPYTLNPILIGNTTYEVRVQAACTTSWSNVATFTTACDAESMPWSENFDTWTSKSVCWSFMQGQYNMGQGTPTTYSSAWGLSSSYGNYITIDGKALTMNIYNTYRYWAVTPAINITTDDAVLKVDVAVAGWNPANTNYDDNDTLAFAISTDGGNTFTNLRVLDGDDLNNLGNDYTTIYVPVAGYNGQAVRFAIFGGSSASGGDNRCVIDNVSVEEAPSCYPVGTLTYDPESVTPFSANLSWTLIDNTQDGWRITYATNAELTENMQAITVTSHENYTLSGLTPETHYYVAVCAFCGAPGYGAASNIIEFTTGIACQKPTDLAPSNIQQTSVDLSWTENGTASAWKVAYKDEDAADFSETMVLVNPYTLNGLTQGTNYTVKVRAICGGDYGNSQWSDEINFQTVAACPAPTNLAVTDGSVDGHGATITWEGTNDSYTIEYAEGPLAGLATLLNEGFEGGSMPTGWTVDGNGSWSVGTGDYNSSTGAGEGTYNAQITHGNSGDDTKLITPAIDLSGVTTATLSFMHIERSWSGDIDQLRVYYRTSSSDSWTLLAGQEYTTEVASWTTEDNINLPNPSSTYQIAFEMTDGYGFGVGIDEVIVTAEYNPTYIWNELASGVNGNTYTINTLDPETQYVVRMKGMCGTTPSPASNIVGFETPEACPAPTNVTVNNSTITDNSAEISWDGSASGYNVRYRTATYSPTYYFNDFNEPSATGWSYSGSLIYGIDDPITSTPGGANYFLAMGWSTTDEETIISPELPAYSNGSVVEFYYFGYTISNTFQVGYSSTTSDADAFTWGSPITAPLAVYTLYSEALPAGTKYVAFKATASEQYASIFIDNFGIYNTVPAGDWTTTTASSNSTVIGSLTPETTYDVEVQAVCGSDLSAWVATTFTTLEACAAPTAFVPDDVEAHQATFSWTAGNGNTSWDVYVKKHADAEYPATASATVTAATATATINELDAATVYDVKIVPDCDDTKVLEVANAFTTECETTVVDTDNPFFEGFEGTTFPPICWSVGDPSNNYNWQRSTQYSNTGSACAYSNYYGPIYLYTPILHIDGTTATLSFSSYNTFVSDYDKNRVLVSVNGGAWTELWSPESVSDSWVVTTIDMTAYVGQNIQLCFKYEGDNAHGWYIDDVNLYVPTVIAKAIEANKWYAISTPVHNNGNNETVAGVTNLTNEANDLYLYNEAESKWVKEATSLAVGKGYIYRRAANATLSFVGTANSGDRSATVTATTGTGTDAELQGFNLIGNPYPHAISYENDHYTLNTNGTWEAHTDGIIGVAEGFMVRVSADGNVDFEDVPATKSSTSSSSLAFTVSNGEFEDVAYARFENGEGLPKIGHLDANAPMLSIPVDGRRYAIANLGYDCENFDMNFRGTGEYTITLNTQHSSLNYCHLVDRTTGADIDLLQTPSYTFSANGSDAGRFLVKLAPNAQETTTGNFAYTDGRNWTVEGDGMLQVFDVLGRRIMTKEVSSQLTIPTTQFPAAGVYILRLGEKSQKIVVK